MSLPPHNVGEDVVFGAVALSRLFVRPDRYCYDNVSWTP